MKKLILSAVMLVALAFSAQSQEIRKNAIGLRLGANDGFGGEVSYQRAISDNNRLEFDLGIRDTRNTEAVKLVGLYQWVWNIEGGFNWYAGVGAGVGSWRHDGPWNNGNNNDWDDGGTFLLAAGDIGIEYVFDIPLMVSLDFRPELYFGDDRRNYDGYDYNSFGPDVALSVRFTF
ncbi:MAG: hypothetical protein ITG00_10145 [Flavobacterium sp.]|nr:hypothetical protein [Flavobacterium sp.]